MRMGKTIQKGKKLKKAGSGIVILVLTLVLVISAGFMLQGTENVTSDSGILIKNHKKIVSSIRAGLREHSREITVRFTAKRDHMDGIETLVAELMEAALEETDNPAEGDYIRYQYGGYQMRYSCKEKKSGYLYTIRIIPDYYTYLSEEQMVTERVQDILESFRFNENTTDYEKTRQIYDYICNTVSYDEVHKEKESNHKKTTAYSALFYNTAVCQGYSVLMYRLLREAGVDARVVTGTVCYNGNEEFHAWNLVCVDGEYYNVDATLGKARGTDDYFLKSDAVFSNDYVRDEKFTTVNFMKRYPMASDDYSEIRKSEWRQL